MEYMFLTGGNSKDKDTRRITFEEAQKMVCDTDIKNAYKPICSMVILDGERKYRKIIYFKKRVIIYDFDTTKQVWYEKVNDDEYFIDQIAFENYRNQNKYVEVHLRNRDFSDPNICMIRVGSDGRWKYYVGDIDDSKFYRKIEFGDTDILYNDIETNFESYLMNVKECGKNFLRHP